MKPVGLGDLMHEAYERSGECPAPERLLPSSMNAASPAEKKQIEEHVERCAACAAESSLAREFEASPEEAATLKDDVDHVQATLSGARIARGRSPGSTAPASVGTSRSRYRNFRTWGLAAAAVFVLAVVGFVATLQPLAPPLPSLSEETTVRGSRLELVRPLGELRAIPERFEWEAVPGAAGYRVRVVAVDDTVLFESAVNDRFLDLSADFVDSLRPAVVYRWRVEALDEDGMRLAWSEEARFRAMPE